MIPTVTQKLRCEIEATRYRLAMLDVALPRSVDDRARREVLTQRSILVQEIEAWKELLMFAMRPELYMPKLANMAPHPDPRKITKAEPLDYASAERKLAEGAGLVKAREWRDGVLKKIEADHEQPRQHPERDDPYDQH